MATTDSHRTKRADARWTLLKLVLALLAMIAWWVSTNRPSGQHVATPDVQQRMPITHPILESDRPDLLGEPGMEMVETDDANADAGGERDPG